MKKTAKKRTPATSKMKTSRKVLYLVIALSLIACIGFFTSNEIGDGLIALVVFLLCAVIAFWPRIIKANKANTAKPAKAAAVSAPPKMPEPQPIIMGEGENGYERKYLYENVEVAGSSHYNLSGVKVGAYVSIKPEPENEHDKDAVAVIANETPIGYLHKGSLQTMVHDYIKKDGFAAGRITSIDGEKVEMLLGFFARTNTEYDILLKSAGKRKAFKLIGNKNEDMQNNLALCQYGEEIQTYLDHDKGKYVAESTENIGYFPVSANEMLENDHRAFISEITLGDNAEYIIKVTVFPQ